MPDPRRLRGVFVVEAQSDLSVEDAATRWLATYIATQRADKGRRLAAQRVRDFLVPCLGPRAISGLGSEDCRSYRLWLERTTRLCATTVWHVLADCRCFLRWCEDCGLLDHSPFPRRLMPKLQEQAPRRLAAGEVAKLCALPDPFGWICRLGVGTGLRWSEMCRARASDFQGGELVVQHHTKSGKIRRIPVSRALATELAARSGPLIALTHGAWFARKVKRMAGLERFHPHMLRHTFGCQWIERGGSLAALKDMLGHSSYDMVQRYARMSGDAVKREAARVWDDE